MLRRWNFGGRLVPAPSSGNRVAGGGRRAVAGEGGEDVVHVVEGRGLVERDADAPPSCRPRLMPRASAAARTREVSSSSVSTVRVSKTGAPPVE